MSYIEIDEGWSGPGSRDGEIVVPPLAENGRHDSPHTGPIGGAFEHWYFDARLDDGWTIVGFLQTSELVTKKPGVELHVYRPDGTRVEIRKQYPPAAARASAERCDVTVGHNWVRIEDETARLPRYRLHLEEDGVRFDLVFQAAVPAWRPGDGGTRFGPRDHFSWVVPAPRAEVTGTIALHGEQREVRGIGYHDHNWGVGFMPRIVSRWYWGRIYADDLSLIYAMVGLNGKRFGPDRWIKPVMLAHEDRIVLSTGEVTISEGPHVFHPDADNTYPEYYELKTPELSLRLDVRRVIHAHNLLEDAPVIGNPRVLPIVKPLLNRLAGHPGYFRFESDFRIVADIDGTTYEREGTTLHEMVALT